jgi:Tol biopolymer transport system component
VTRRSAVAAAAAAGLLGLAPVAGWATSLPQRTFPVTTDVKGPSTDGAVSMDGSAIALVASGNVYVSSVLTGASSLISVGLGGAPANGPSSTPAISGDGSAVAFASTATNLTTAGGSGTTQIYLRGVTVGIEPISVAADGGPANGPSSEPAISVDGRYVAFASTATNLVAGDRNAASDIFVRDRLTRTTVRASVARGGVEANGPSTTPAISGDGRVIGFASAATNLVGGGRGGGGGGGAGVYVRIPSTDATELVSVSTRGQPQNAGVTKPYTQISSLSLDGRLVAFDSNATNLVSGEDPRPRTNVFVRDRRRHTTTLVSQDNAGYEGNNDSFAPFITPSGLFVTFESFARNLAPGGGPRENVFVRDVNLRTTSVVNVTPAGSAPGPEIGGELLERPTLSTDGSVATFTSTAARLTGDASGVPAVFLRLMTAPRGFLRRSVPTGRRPQVTVGADDPGATSFECRIDLRLPFACPPGRLRLPVLAVGRHQLQVRAGGPGMLYDPLGLRVTLRVTPRG